MTNSSIMSSSTKNEDVYLTDFFSSHHGIEPRNVTRSDDMKSVIFDHPGLSYSMFDGDHNPTIKGLMDMAGSGEDIGIGRRTDTSIFGYDWLSDSNLIFVLNSEYKISRVIYRKDVSKTNLTCQVALLHVGRSTCVTRISFFLGNDPEPIMSNQNLLINVDKTSRKSKPFPSWMVERFQGMKTVTSNLKKKPFNRPSDTFIQRVCVMWSDTDFNGHCNVGSYVTYAYNAIYTALRLRDFEKTASIHSQLTSLNEDSYNGSPSVVLNGISEEVVKEGVKNMKLNCFQECLQGQQLNVHIWQDRVKDTVVYCSIETKDKVICQIVLDFFDRVSKL